MEQVADVGDVVPSVGLSGDVDSSSLKLRVFLEEPSDEDVEVVSNSNLVSVVVDRVSLSEPDSQRLVDINQISEAVPRELVHFEDCFAVSPFLREERPVFQKETDLRRSSGTDL